MAYNKAKEERKWKLWKESEEQILHKAGMNEDAIQKLRQMDWEDFNEERRYREHLSKNQKELDIGKEPEFLSEVLNIRQLLDSVENEQLLYMLMESDKKTLQILLFKMWGFSVREISSQMGIPEKTIYTRMARLKKKIEKILKK